MANNDLAMRFTENKYATKNEVSKELKISVIDGVWDKILSYRSLFYQYLSVKGIDKGQLRVCLCPTIDNKVKNVEEKLARLLNDYRKLDRVNGDSQYFELEQSIKCLQNIAVKKNLVSDKETIKKIINGDRQNRDLANYHDALKFVERKYNNTIDVDYLADLYSLVTGNQELTSFYRDIDNEDVNSSAIISRVYKSAPHNLIEQMMEGLFVFIEKSPLKSVLNKALITFYYVEFVKPFKNYNDEIAVLLAKSVLAHNGFNEFAACLPFEALLNENANEMNRLFYEVQLTSDVTYFLTFALDSVDHIFDRLLDNLADYSSQIIKNDFYRVDDNNTDQLSLFEEVKEEPAPKVEEKKPEPKVEQPVERIIIKEVIREVPAPTEEKKEEPKKEVPVMETVENKPQGLAVSFIPEELDEKTALRLERHLLELDVRLKKGQAAFYARHCTLGMYYTIEQYKKATKCVYETARTSMEKLVEFGYYEKKLVGKKFVYTPVKRK